MMTGTYRRWTALATTIAVSMLLGCGDSPPPAPGATVWAWGYNNSGQLGDGTNTDRLTPEQVGGLSGVNAIVGGGDHSLARK